MSPTATNFVQTIVNDPDNGSNYVRVTTAGATTPQLTGFVAVLPGVPSLEIGPGLSGMAAWLQGPPGPVTVTIGQQTVSAASGVNFVGAVNVNQKLVFASDTTKTQYTVQTVTSTSLTINPAYAGASGTTAATTVTPSGTASFVLTPSLGGVAQSPINVTLWADKTAMPSSLASLLRLFSIATRRALQAQYPGAQVTAQAVCLAPDALANSLQISVSLPNNYDALVAFAEPSPPPAAGSFDLVEFLGLSAMTPPPPYANVGAYYFAHAAVPAGAQLSGGVAPADAPNLPNAIDIVGSEAAPGPGGTLVQTGIYALDKVDLFNILCIPDATRASVSNPSSRRLPRSVAQRMYGRRRWTIAISAVPSC